MATTATPADVERIASNVGEYQIKSVDDEQRIIYGWASTPAPDRQGDSIDPFGAVYETSIPLLLQHDKGQQVGHAFLGPPTADGIPFTATISRITEPGLLKDRVDLAWQSIKAKFFAGMSPGYRALLNAARPNKSGGFDFLKTEILELSLVTIPANPAAAITGYKHLAASGRDPSAVADLSTETRTTMQTIQEQITHWTTERGPLVQQMADMVTADRTLADQEAKAYDQLAGKVAAIDEQVGRLRILEKANMAAAAPLVTPPTPTTPAITRPASPITVRPVVPKGTAFVRAVCARIMCKGNNLEAAQYAERWKDSTPEVSMYLKAAVAPATVQDQAWAGSLVGNISGEFLELLRPATAIGRIPGLRKVPFNTKVPAQTAGGTYNWVGEAKPKPVTKLVLTSTTLPMTKAAGIIVLTEELARLSNPNAEDVAREDMIAGISAFVDAQFIDPAVAAVANVKPASVTNGVTPIASVGPLSDLVAIASAFTAAGVPLTGLTYIMSPSNALVLSFRRDANGNVSFPDMTADGGKVNGLNVVTSGAAGSNVIGLIPSLILYGDEGGVEIDVATQASLQMSDAPMDPADATTVFVSLWQNNLIGLRAEWFVSWLKANANAVKYVNNATYTIGGPATAEASGPAAKHANGGTKP